MTGIDGQNSFDDEDENRLVEDELVKNTTTTTDTDAEFVGEEDIVEDADVVEGNVAGKPLRKKRAALRARHALEDYFDQKKIEKELDYLALELEKQKKEKQK